MPLWAQKIVSTGGWLAFATSVIISIWWWTHHQVAMWVLDLRWYLLIPGVCALIYVRCEHIAEAIKETFEIGTAYGLSHANQQRERESQ